MLARSTWETGQDQCASIKRQLAAMLPGVSIFLDVSHAAYISYCFSVGLLCDRFPFCALILR